MNQQRIKLIEGLIKKSEDIQFKAELSGVRELAELVEEILQNLLRNEL